MASQKAYANYVLGVLALVSTANVLDRYLPSILLQPIKDEFGVSDTAMGVLTGLAFALINALAGFPVSRWADWGVRRSIIAMALAFWSVATALSGLAQSFSQLLVARVGVAVGESGAGSPTQSLVADYFPGGRRATALAIQASGGTLGIALAYGLGGYLNEQFGWRATFFLVGLPGLLLALVVRFTIREPQRSSSSSPQEQGLAFRGVVSFLLKRPAFLQQLIASSLHNFSTFGAATWHPSFLMRVHDMGTASAGLTIALLVAPFTVTGHLVGAYLADRLGRRDVRWYMYLQAMGALIALPFYLAFYLWPADTTLLIPIPGRDLPLDVPTAVFFLIPASFFVAFWTGPASAMILGIAPPQMRAQASQTYHVFSTLIGMGVGPLLVGVLSDLLHPGFGDESLRYALLVIALPHGLAILYNMRSARTLRDDLHEGWQTASSEKAR